MNCSCKCCRAQARRQNRPQMICLNNIYEADSSIVPVGELRGLIYRVKRFPYQRPKNFIHFFKKQYPVLVTNFQGTRLYISSGGYRVTHRGIQG